MLIVTKKKKIGISIDNALLLDSRIKEVCKKASQKLGVLSRLVNYLEPEERKLIFNSLWHGCSVLEHQTT